MSVHPPTLQAHELTDAEVLRAALLKAAPDLAMRADSPTAFVASMAAAFDAIRARFPTPTLQLDEGVSTLDAEAIELALDWEEVLAARKRELEAYAAAGVPMPAWVNLGTRKPPDEPPAEPLAEPSNPAGPKDDGGAGASWNPAIRSPEERLAREKEGTLLRLEAGRKTIP